jgi:hypothetical protein
MFLRSILVILCFSAAMRLANAQTNVPPPSHIFVRGVESSFLDLSNVAIIRRNEDTATLMFDVGSATDDEGEPLSFIWYEVSPDQPLSTEVRLTNDYASGAHRVYGWIADSQEGVTGQADFEVITPLEAVRLLSGDVEINGFRRDITRARKFLRLAEDGIQRRKWQRGEYRLNRFVRQIEREFAEGGEEDLALNQRWTDAADAIQHALQKVRRNQPAEPEGVFPGR